MQMLTLNEGYMYSSNLQSIFFSLSATGFISLRSIFQGDRKGGGRGNRRIKGRGRKKEGMKNRRGDSHPRNLDELAYRFGLTKPKLA